MPAYRYTVTTCRLVSEESVLFNEKNDHAALKKIEKIDEALSRERDIMSPRTLERVVRRRVIRGVHRLERSKIVMHWSMR